MALVSRTGRTVQAVVLQTAPTSRCPEGQEWDTIDNVCREAAVRLVAAPTRTLFRTATPTDPVPFRTAIPVEVEVAPGRPWPPKEALPPAPAPAPTAVVSSGGGGVVAYDYPTREILSFPESLPDIALPGAVIEVPPETPKEGVQGTTLLLVGAAVLLAYLVVKQ